jgi:TolB protein
VSSRVTSVFVLAVICMAASGTSAHAAFPGANGRIAFTNGLQGSNPPPSPLLTVNPDGSGSAPVTDPTAIDFGPAWSPDGSRIAFTSSRGDPDPVGCYPNCNWDIYVVNADGSGLMRLTDDPAFDQTPEWSPDGSKIVWSSRGAGQFYLWVMNSDGSGKRQLTSEYSESPSWSPDGSKIAFTAAGRINVINPDGTGRAELPVAGGSSAEWDSAVDWSPEGSRIAFARTTSVSICAPVRCTFGRYSDVYVMNADGTGLQNLTTPEGGEFARYYCCPTWSPDGTRIAFGADSLDGGISTMNPDGTGVALVTSTGYPTSWQPIPGPEPGAYANARQFCKAERDFLGKAEFRRKYGRRHAFRSCVRQHGGRNGTNRHRN